MSQTLETSWQGFFQAVMPKDASDAQVRDMKRAYFSGIFAMLTIMHSVAAIDDDEECAARLNEIEQECTKFMRSIGQGN